MPSVRRDGTGVGPFSGSSAAACPRGELNANIGGPEGYCLGVASEPRALGAFMRVHEHERLRAYAQRTRAAWLVAVVVGMLLALGLVYAPTSWATGRTTLIVAPHPDDDLLYGAGVVATGLANGDSVKVVYMTNGDRDSVAQGLTREGEAVNGQAVLGTPESDLIFLGYPTGFLLTIWESYLAPTDRLVADNGLSATYGAHGLGGTDYPRTASAAPLPTTVRMCSTVLKAILATYRPDDIYTPPSSISTPITRPPTTLFVRRCSIAWLLTPPTIPVFIRRSCGALIPRTGRCQRTPRHR